VIHLLFADHLNLVVDAEGEDLITLKDASITGIEEGLIV